MIEAKNTQRAIVRIGYDGRVHKQFQGPNARERFENECRVLIYLENRKCPFVPRLLGADSETLEIVTNNCGARVERMGDDRIKSIFKELESFGVRHDDAFLRNITYRASDGRFCVIDFEFSTILEENPELESDALALSMNATSDATIKTSNRPIDVRWSAMTHPGTYRKNNEDRFLAMLIDQRGVRYLGKDGQSNTRESDMLFAVADGMGGERSGELAGKIALDNITKILPRAYMMTHQHLVESAPAILKGLFSAIHAELVLLGEGDPLCNNMGATLTLIWIHRSTVMFAHIGDTRLYHFHRPTAMDSSDTDENMSSLVMTQLSEDHTYVGWLRRMGKLNERESRFHPRKNVLSKALGAGNQFVDPQCGTFELLAGEKLVLCTDGVSEGLWDRALRELVLYPESSIADLTPAQRIVLTAVDESGKDNTTAMVIEAQSNS
jgi:serine/threonine protein phosphatase PrpC